MTTLSFSLLPGSLSRFHEALTCLGKYSDDVGIEAERDLLRLSALNSSKTAYSSFAFDPETFFERYEWGLSRNASSSRTASAEKFSCEVFLRALLSVFPGRTNRRDKDTAVERCEFEVHEDPDVTECRLVIRMICGLGVIKSYKLTYEPTTIQHAIFDRSQATNEWTIEPVFLKEITTHFSPSAEQLDIYSENTKVIFTSFTTKITDGKDTLRQPVHTSVAIDKTDFEDYAASDGVHFAISLKDFKAVISHAENTGVLLTARYTRPCRPLQLAYDYEGIRTEFTLMTTGEAGPEDLPSSSRPVRELSARQTSVPIRAPSAAAAPAQPRGQAEPAQASASSTTKTMAMAPPRGRPVRPLTGMSSRGTQSSTQATATQPAPSLGFEDSLFVPADDDRQWDVAEAEEAEEEDMLGWDATADPDNPASLGPIMRDSEPGLGDRMDTNQDEMGIPPTQRMSQVHGLGLFD
ncbi:Rad9-domain-containing protein [Aspergillus unguis]